jgi:hypothetical protein
MRYAVIAVLLAVPSTLGAQKSRSTESRVLAKEDNSLVFRLGKAKRRMRFKHRILEMRAHPTLPFVVISTTRDPIGGKYQMVHDVFVVDLERRRKRSVKRRGASCGEHRTCPLESKPWSPDGQHLALVSDLNRGVEVFATRQLRQWIRRGGPKPQLLIWPSEPNQKTMEPAKFYSVRRWLRSDRLAFAADCCGTDNTVVYDFAARTTKVLGICSGVAHSNPKRDAEDKVCHARVRAAMTKLSKP